MKYDEMFRTIRKELNVSREKLARMLDICGQKVFLIETRKTVPTVYDLENLAKLLNISVFYLIARFEEGANISSEPCSNGKRILKAEIECK